MKLFSSRAPGHLVVFSFSYLFLASALSATTITAAVAANVQFAIQKINDTFHQKTGHRVNPVLGSSGKLTAQISNGAPYHIFLSANMKYPENLYEKKLTRNRPKIYARGTLVLWSTTDHPLHPDLQSLVKSLPEKIALANPQTAPYGVEALRALKNSGSYDALQSRLVFGESISQVNRYIVSRSVDVGFTAKSVVLSPEMKNTGKWVDVNPKLYTPIQQGVVLLDRGSDDEKKVADEYYEFLFSDEAQSIFREFGYRVKD